MRKKYCGHVSPYTRSPRSRAARIATAACSVETWTTRIGTSISSESEMTRPVASPSASAACEIAWNFAW